MKRLVLVRHAKAVPYGYDDDFERELQQKGINDANRTGTKLKEMGIVPDQVYSSPALRALKTATIFAEKTDYPTEKIQQDIELYEGLTTREFISYLRSIPDDLNTVFFFGHNPLFFHYAMNLLPDFFDDMPTCATIVIDFPVNSWADVETRSGKKSAYLIPRNLH